ncbi:hypothetical protein [Pseudarthrobacter sp. H2]|uniref:hypothetical protein n=1 Tax=Pseudarthrobacter sp. H2 TaxID=3418415 RepID=UPI003CF34E68
MKTIKRLLQEIKNDYQVLVDYWSYDGNIWVVEYRQDRILLHDDKGYDFAKVKLAEFLEGSLQ